MITRLIEEWDTIPSTQDRAVQLAKEGAPHGSYVTAKEQTNGYGRSGKWWSPPGGLYFSLILDGQYAHDSLVDPVHLMALNVGAGIEDYIQLHQRRKPGWKYLDVPNESNDIVTRHHPRAKIGGVIATSVADRVIFGIGINKLLPPTSRMLWDMVRDKDCSVTSLRAIYSGLDFDSSFDEYLIQALLAVYPIPTKTPAGEYPGV